MASENVQLVLHVPGYIAHVIFQCQSCIMLVNLLLTTLFC